MDVNSDGGILQSTPTQVLHISVPDHHIPEKEIITLADNLAMAIANATKDIPALPSTDGNDQLSDYDTDLLLDTSFMPDEEIDWDLIANLEKSGLLQTSPTKTDLNMNVTPASLQSDYVCNLQKRIVSIPPPRSSPSTGSSKRKQKKEKIERIYHSSMWNDRQFEQQVQERLQQTDGVDTKIDELPFPPSFDAWKRRQLDISVNSEVRRRRERDKLLRKAMTEPDKSLFTKLKLKDGNLTKEYMQLQCTLASAIIKTLPKTTSGAIETSYVQSPSPQQDVLPTLVSVPTKPVSQLMSYRPPLFPQVQVLGSRSYSTRTPHLTTPSIQTVRHTLDIHKISTLSRQDKLQVSQNENMTVSIVATPSDSAEVMARCPLFLP